MPNPCWVRSITSIIWWTRVREALSGALNILLSIEIVLGAGVELVRMTIDNRNHNPGL